MDNSKEELKNKSKNKKKKFRFKAIYLIPIIFVMSCLAFAYYIFSSTQSDGPIYGNRCANVLEIDASKLIEAQAAIANNEKLSSVSIEKNCLAVKITLTFKDDVSVEDAKKIATEATKTLDQTLGFEKNNASDSYSKIFGVDGDRRQYDIQLTLYGSSEGFPVFGNKHYQSNEIQYTDSNAKSQELVNELTTSEETAQ